MTIDTNNDKPSSDEYQFNSGSRLYTSSGDPFAEDADGNTRNLMTDQTASSSSSTESLLRSGEVVGVTPNNRYTAQPSDGAFSTHDQAIQDVIDQIQTGSEPGYVYIPAIPDDGSSNILIENTVNIDNANGPGVLPRGYGFWTQDAPYMDTNISDGSPMFHIDGVRSMKTPFGWMKVSAPGQDAEFIRLTDFNEPNLRSCEVRGLGTSSPSASGAFVLDSETTNGRVVDCVYNQRGGGGEDPTVSGMNAFAARNSLGTNGPGEITLIGVNTYADPASPFNNGFDSNTNCSNIAFVAGRFEGAGGEAHFSLSQGELIIGSPFELGRTENSADGVYHTGYSLVVADGVYGSATIDGNGINFAAPGRGHIGTVFMNCNGDDVVVGSVNGAGNQVTVPHESSLLGTTNYNAGDPDIWVESARSNP